MKIKESKPCTGILNPPMHAFTGHLFHHVFSINDDPQSTSCYVTMTSVSSTRLKSLSSCASLAPCFRYTESPWSPWSRLQMWRWDENLPQKSEKNCEGSVTLVYGDCWATASLVFAPMCSKNETSSSPRRMCNNDIMEVLASVQNELKVIRKVFWYEVSFWSDTRHATATVIWQGSCHTRM